MDEKDGGGGGVGAQSVIPTPPFKPPFRSISLNAGALAAQRNSGIVPRIHSTLTTTNHLEIVAGDVRSGRTPRGDHSLCLPGGRCPSQVGQNRRQPKFLKIPY